METRKKLKSDLSPEEEEFYKKKIEAMKRLMKTKENLDKPPKT